MNERQGISVVLDESRHAFHVTCAPGYNSRQLGRVLDDLEAQGYELLDSDEEPKEILHGDRIRIWLRRVVVGGLVAAAILIGANTLRAASLATTESGENVMASGVTVVKRRPVAAQGPVSRAGQRSALVEAPLVALPTKPHDDVFVRTPSHPTPPRTDRQPVKQPAKCDSLRRQVLPSPCRSNVLGRKQASDRGGASHRLKPVLGLTQDLLQPAGHPVELLVGEVVPDPGLLQAF